jgi:hypothetical protein
MNAHVDPGTSLRRHSLTGVLAKTFGDTWVKIPIDSKARIHAAALDEAEEGPHDSFLR